MKKKTTKKVFKVKPRNAGTMTDNQFFQWLRQTLRRASLHWRPISQAKKEAQIPYIGPNKRRKYSYVCAECKGEFASTEINVHHNIECGNLKSFDDLPGFTERLFCEKQFLSVLCKTCHDQIHGIKS